MRAVTRELAAFAVGAPSAHTSARAVDVVTHATLDLFGVIVAGSQEEAGQQALQYARSQAADGASAVLGGKLRIAPSLAALANGTAGHALDYDDIGLGAGHISVAILPALFALGEHIDADGISFIDALVVGYEIAHRLTTMYSDTRLGPYAAGYHKPSVYSSLGAAAGCARLLGLSPQATAHAIGIAASQSGGLRANFGTMTKPLHAGIANRSAVEAALLAGSGFTATPDVLEQRFGWHDVICRGEGELDAVLDDLDHVGKDMPYAIEEGLNFKAYPCCGANHYAIDGVINLMREAALTEAEVESLDVWIEARNLNDVLVYPWARTPLEGKFCLAYNTEAALADGDVTVNTFTDAAVARLTAGRGRVRVHATDQLPQNGARIELVTTDGRRFGRQQLILHGSIEDPMDWSDLERKFRANVLGRFPAHAVDDVIRATAGLARLPNLTALSEPLLG